MTLQASRHDLGDMEGLGSKILYNFQSMGLRFFVNFQGGGSKFVHVKMLLTSPIFYKSAVSVHY